MNLNELWDSLPDAEPKKDFGPLEEGTYRATLVSAVLKEAQSGDPMVEWEYKVVDGEYKNRRLWKKSYLNEKGFGWFKKDLVALGVADVVKDANRDIPLALEGVTGAEIEIFVNKRPGTDGKIYNNVYVNRVLSGSDNQSDDEEEADVPFFTR